MNSMLFRLIIIIGFNSGHPHSGSYRPLYPDRIGIWKCWFLGRGENRSTRRKTSRSSIENQQQTQPTYDTEGRGERGKPEYPEKNLSEQHREPTTNSTHIWHRGERGEGRGENRSTRRKTSQSRVENQQQTQPTYDVETGNRTRATLVGGECTHHCAIPVPRWEFAENPGELLSKDAQGVSLLSLPSPFCLVVSRTRYPCF